MALLAVQTAWAETPGAASRTNGPGAEPAASESPVIVAGMQVPPNPWASGQTAPGQEISGQAVPDQMPAAQLVPEQPQPGEQNQEMVSSPVVIAGQSQSGLTPQQEAETAQQEAAAQEAETAQQEAAAQEAEAAQESEAAQQQAASGRTVDPSRPMVALTYDDGPQASVGNRIMDCLAQYGGKATFFMVGERVPSFKTEVQRMVNEGHEVANHTMNHKYLQKLGAAEIQSQVTRCNDAIEAACGVRPRLMRLPGGNYNAAVKANTNMPMIQWNIDTLDWKTRNADKTVNAVLSQVKDGDIILMHELYSQTGDASLRIIPELANRGFQMVTVSEMAAAKGYDLQPGQLYSSMK